MNVRRPVEWVFIIVNRKFTASDLTAPLRRIGEHEQPAQQQAPTN